MKRLVIIILAATLLLALTSSTFAQRSVEEALNVGLSGSIRWTEIVENDGQTAWTGAANVTATADASIYKVGTKSAKLVIAEGFTTGPIAYGVPVHDNLNLSLFTHVQFYAYAPTTAVPAGTYQLAFDNAATFDTAEGAGHRSMSIPALAADTWQRVTIDLAAGNAGYTSITSLSSLGLSASADPGVRTIYIDDVRFLHVDTSGSTIKIADVTPLEGTVLELPWQADIVSFEELPIDLYCQWYHVRGSTTAAGGRRLFLAGEIPTDLHRKANQLRLNLGADLAVVSAADLSLNDWLGVEVCR